MDVEQALQQQAESVGALIAANLLLAAAVKRQLGEDGDDFFADLTEGYSRFAAGTRDPGAQRVFSALVEGLDRLWDGGA